MDRTGFQNSPTTRVGFRIVDHMTAAYLAISINLALVYKKRTGKGQFIDLAELDCMFAMMETGPWVYSITGEVLPRTGNSYPSISPYDSLRAKDGFVSVGISTDRQWQKFCAVLDFEDLAKNPVYMTNESRGDNYESGLKQEHEANMQKMGKFDIEAKLQGAKLPCASVYTVAEAMATEHTAVHEMLVEVEDKGAGKVTIPGTTIKMIGTPGSVTGGAPLLGEHTKAYMTQLGYSENEIQTLANANIIALA
jgi:crotonobetainyl-CoA:carnitine CoA-transferase CaiB-like acyl-CoA transferase